MSGQDYNARVSRRWCLGSRRNVLGPTRQLLRYSTSGKYNKFCEIQPLWNSTSGQLWVFNYWTGAHVRLSLQLPINYWALGPELLPIMLQFINYWVVIKLGCWYFTYFKPAFMDTSLVSWNLKILVKQTHVRWTTNHTFYSWTCAGALFLNNTGPDQFGVGGAPWT